MDLWVDLFTDPVAIFTAVGMGIMMGIGIFLIWFFILKLERVKKLGLGVDVRRL